MKSMTGYGSAEGKVGRGRVFVEIKSVNHRYCDILLKIPPKMNPVDPLIRKVLKDHIERGKVELYLKERQSIVAGKDLLLDIDLARKYDRCFKKLQQALGGRYKDIHILEVIDAKELISIQDINVDYARYWDALKKLVLQAIKKLDGMKVREGNFLLSDQSARLKKIDSHINRISGQSKESLKKCQARIKSRFPMGSGTPPALKDRLEMEVAALADKMDIAEELIRLKSHLNQYGQILKQGGPQGRQLDFLLQEMNREINTLGAKANDAKISSYVVNVKSELEKLREQVQNIE